MPLHPGGGGGCFNSRTREGCDTARARQKPPTATFQFTHPGGVRQIRPRLQTTRFLVSIHAPGRGATHINDALKQVTRVSIHAPGRGATGVFPFLLYYKDSFNSRTREGCDTASTHSVCLPISFNSRTREGCDLLVLSVRCLRLSFNSRTREGCDRMSLLRPM